MGFRPSLPSEAGFQPESDYEEKFRRNAEHLNYYGANKVSNWVAIKGDDFANLQLD